MGGGGLRGLGFFSQHILSETEVVTKTGGCFDLRSVGGEECGGGSVGGGDRGGKGSVEGVGG